MPTTFWAKRGSMFRFALVGLLAGGSAMATLPANTTASAHSHASVESSAPVLKLQHKAGKARLEIRLAGGKVQTLPLKTDANVNPKNAGANVELVALVANKTLLITDNWASRPGPLSMCQAGQESFLRVIQLTPLKEILSLKLASCRDNMELATPGLTWQADTSTLKINWLSGPDQIPLEKILQLGADGKATLTAP